MSIQIESTGVNALMQAAVRKSRQELNATEVSEATEAMIKYQNALPIRQLYELSKALANSKNEYLQLAAVFNAMAHSKGNPAINDLLAYKQYATERLAIEKELEENIRKLQAGKSKKGKDGKEENDPETDRRIEKLKTIADNDKKRLEEVYGFTESGFNDFIDTIIKAGFDSLLTLITEIQTELDKIGDKNPTKSAELIGKLEFSKQQLSTAIKAGVKTEKEEEEEKKQEGQKAKEEKEKDRIANWKPVVKAMEDMQKTTKETISCFGELDENIQKSIDAALNISSSVIGIIQLITMTAWSGKSAVEQVEKASAILAIVSLAIQMIMTIFNLFRNSKINRQIDESKERVKDLERQYTMLGYTIKKALGTDYYQKQIQQAGLMTQKAAELGKQIELTQQKSVLTKKKKKQKKEDIAELQKQQAEALSQAQEIRQKVIDDLATTDLRSFSQKLAESLIEGYTSGVKDLGTVVEKSMDELLRNMIAKQFDIMVAQKALQPMFDVMEKSLEDFTLTETELNDIKNAQQKSKANLLHGGEEYRKMMEKLGLIDAEEDASGSQESSKGFQSMSQDTGNRLDGIFTMVQIHTAAINGTVSAIRESQLNMEPVQTIASENIDIIATASRLQLEQLTAIEKNTRLLNETNLRLKNIENNTNRL